MAINIYRWSARILTILAILFMGLFSMDVFEMDVSFGQKMLGLLMHNIPALVLAVILVVAWKKELAGGILVLMAALSMMFYFHSFTSNKGSLVIFIPFLLVGILFIVCNAADKNLKKQNK
jgi:hypothetical protein